MRWWILGGTVAALGTGLVLSLDVSPVRSISQQAFQRVGRLLNEKEVHISGIDSVRREEIEPLLPADRGVPWWILNKSQIEQTLLRLPKIEKAEVKSCGSLFVTSWGCFNVEIVERRPRYVAVLSDQVWILGADGGFILPIIRREYETSLPQDLVRRYFGPKAQLQRPLIELFVDGDAPADLEARLGYLRSAIEIIETSSNLNVVSGRCSRDGEVRVRFDDYPFQAIFDYSQGDPESLRKSAKRLARVVKEFGARIFTVELIDLAYNKLAVVRFTGTPVPTVAPGKKAPHVAIAPKR